MRGRLADAAGLLAMARAEDDTAVLADLAAELTGLEADVTALRIWMLLGDAYDTHGAVVRIRAAAPEDLASTVTTGTLQRMYRRWAHRHGLPVEVVAEHHAADAGLREVTLTVAAPYAYGLLRGEDGRHTMTATDPFDPQGRARTGHALVEVSPLAEDDDPITLADDDLCIGLYCSRAPDGAGSTLHLLHLPSGVGVHVANDRRIRDRQAQALRIIRSRLLVPRGEPQHVRRYARDTDGKPRGVLDGDLDALLHAAVEARVSGSGPDTT